MAVRGHTKGRMVKRHKDPLGRWTHLEMKAEENKQVHFMGVCQAFKKSEKETLRSRNTAALQQLACPHEECMDPRQHFVRDIKATTKEMQAKDETFFCMGDCNEAAGADDVGTTRLIEDLESEDHLFNCPGADDCSTCARGSKDLSGFLCWQQRCDRCDGRSRSAPISNAQQGPPRVPPRLVC